MALGRPLLRRSFFLGALSTRLAGRPPTVAVRVDELSLAAGGTQRPTRHGLYRDRRRPRFDRAHFTRSLHFQIGFGTHAPVGHPRELARAYATRVQPSLLGLRELDELLLGGNPNTLRPRFIRACARRARGSVTHLGRLTIHALLAQPAERFERVPMLHSPSVAKAGPRSPEWQIVEIIGLL
jgi:hypothetical protein